MNARMPTPEGVIRNTPTGTLVLVSLVVAFALNIMPWDGQTLLMRPDFLLLVTLYWCLEEPRRVGATTAFIAGIVMDVAESALIGQNALAYSLAAYLAITFRLRIVRFSWPVRGLHVFPILVLAQAVFLLTKFMVGFEVPGWEFFARSLIGMALWPILSWLLELPRMQRRRDEVPL